MRRHIAETVPPEKRCAVGVTGHASFAVGIPVLNIADRLPDSPRMARRPNEPVDDPAKVTFRLPDRLVKRAKHYAIDANLDLQDVVREALEQFLARKGAR